MLPYSNTNNTTINNSGIIKFFQKRRLHNKFFYCYQTIIQLTSKYYLYIYYFTNYCTNVNSF